MSASAWAAPAIAIAAAAACVLPTSAVTGVEVIWTLSEQEASDGDEARRPRTCAGALLEQVTVTLTDDADPTRTRTVHYACDAGLQTADEIATLPSPVYFDLRPGDYSLRVRASGPGGLQIAEGAAHVADTGVPRATFDLSPALVPWTIVFTDVELCADTISASLRYADPAADLGESAADTEDTEGPGDGSAERALYRQALTSDHGLALGGLAEPCGTLGEGAHAFAVDPGRYVLDLTIDDRACAIPLEITAPGPTVTPLDLAKLPCDG